jgi:predicted nucleic acid-binding protein
VEEPPARPDERTPADPGGARPKVTGLSATPVYTLDTNAIIYHMQNEAKGAPVLQSILDDPTLPVSVATITEAELCSHANLSDEEGKTIDTILQSVSLVPAVATIARPAGRIRGTYGLKLADSLSATTALFTGSTLIPRNGWDFSKIPHLSVQAI